MGMLKDTWNKFCYKMDALDSPLFASAAVDNKLRQKGWTINVQTFAVPVSAVGAYGVFKHIKNPQSQPLLSVEERRSYLEARKQAAREVYNIR